MTTITVPILVNAYQYKTDQVCGMVKEENKCLVASFNPPLNHIQIVKIFGRIAYKVLTSETEDHIERIHKIQILSWSF